MRRDTLTARALLDYFNESELTALPNGWAFGWCVESPDGTTHSDGMVALTTDDDGDTWDATACPSRAAFDGATTAWDAAVQLSDADMAIWLDDVTAAGVCVVPPEGAA